MRLQYFLITGAYRDYVNDFAKRRLAAAEHAIAVCREFGGQPIFKGGRFVGIAFFDSEEEVPHDSVRWKRAGSTHIGKDYRLYYVPYKRSKWGKDTSEKLFALTMPDTWDFCRDFPCPNDPGVEPDVGVLYNLSFDFVGDEPVIAKHPAVTWEPDPNLILPISKAEFEDLKAAYRS